MGQQSSLDHESSAVQKHIEITQDVITRMAENSRACKIWCVTLVAAVLVLVARTGEPRHALIALAPAVVLYVLDAYYLSLERGFRRSYRRLRQQSSQRPTQHDGPLRHSANWLSSEGSVLGDVQVVLSSTLLSCGYRYRPAGVALGLIGRSRTWLPRYPDTTSS